MIKNDLLNNGCSFKVVNGFFIELGVYVIRFQLFDDWNIGGEVSVGL